MKKKYSFNDDHHIAKVPNNSFSSIEEAREALLSNLCGSFPVESVFEDGIIRLPEWNISIQADVSEMNKSVITTTYYISSPYWDETMYECSSGMGENHYNALGMSQGSFLFGIMDTVMKMMNNENPLDFQSEFAGNKHSWSAYVGNIVGMGDTPKDSDPNVYWNALKDHIAKRIGNQKICYIKIYGANIGNGEVIGECRINNVKSDELSDIVAEIVKTWDTSQFGSHKQFIILKQSEETYIPQPFTKEDIVKATESAMILFEKIENDEYEHFPQMLEDLVGDKNLAWELYSFIPEICAMHAFNKIKYPETILMNYNNENHEYYTTQLFSYYAIFNGVFSAFNNGVLKDTDKTYMEYISVSSVFSAICSAKEQGYDLEESGGSFCTIYSPDDDYIAR